MVLAAFSTSMGLSGGTGEGHVPLQALESEQDRRQGLAREAEATAEQAKTSNTRSTLKPPFKLALSFSPCSDQFQALILRSTRLRPSQRNHLRRHEWAYLRFLYTPMLFLLRPSNCKEKTRAQREINPLTGNPRLVCESSQFQFYLQCITCVWRDRSHTDDQTSSQRRGSSTALLKHAVLVHVLVHVWVCDLKHKSSWLGLWRQGRARDQFRQLTCQLAVWLQRRSKLDRDPSLIIRGPNWKTNIYSLHPGWLSAFLQNEK